MLHFRSKPLPEKAEQYLRELHIAGRSKNTVNLYRASLHHFHRFLLQERIQFFEFSEGKIKNFDEDLARHHLKLVTRNAIISHIHMYLRWLESNGDLQMGFCQKLFPKYRADLVQPQESVLPDLAERFLEVLSATSKPDTVKGYQSALRGFYKNHQKNAKNPYSISKTDVENYSLYLKNKEMGANQRFGRLVQLRRYFDWLHDHKKLKTHPDILLKSTDLPQREEKLPRPFPVDVDLEIQRRLEASQQIDYLGVLLMRRTGLRVGELRSLTIDCITHDLHSNWFLKVPLGKLNNERIIPLDPKTVEITQRIQKIHHGRPEVESNIVYLISNPSGKRRSKAHFGQILREITQDMAIPGTVTVHRLRHSFATSLLSAGLSITTLKKLLGHRDIRMTLGYAAITQETVRNEYFEALSKIQTRYEVASYPLKTPDIKTGMNRAFYDAQKYAKKMAKDQTGLDKTQFNRLCYRLMTLRNEFCQLLKLPEQN